MNFLLQLGRGHWNGSSPVCKRRWALRLYFFEKDLVQLEYGHKCGAFGWRLELGALGSLDVAVEHCECISRLDGEGVNDMVAM